MADPRIEKLAQLLVEYSVAIKKGETLLIMSSPSVAPLIREVYRAALRRGALVSTNIGLDGLDEIFYREASDEQIQWASPFTKFFVEKIDAIITLWGTTNTRSLTGADPKRVAMAAAANQKINNIFLTRQASKDLRWAGTIWPTNASAQDAEMGLEEFTDFVFESGHLNDPDPIATWKAISKRQQALTNALNRSKEIRIVAPDTDITLSVRGRKWVNCDGHANFPDGEICTGPVEHEVNGHIRFSFPAVFRGREASGVALEFKNGKVVSAKADKGQDFLRAMVEMDKGSCYLGELAFGVNYSITRYMRNTLFDEKIGGTVHLALGAGFPETGNANQSGLHWDIVCDLRQGGKVFADGKLIQENGRFLDKRFPQPGKARR